MTHWTTIKHLQVVISLWDFPRRIYRLERLFISHRAVLYTKYIESGEIVILKKNARPR